MRARSPHGGAQQHSATGSKKPPRFRGRGKAKASLELIQAAYDFLEIQHPTTVRGVGYHLFNIRVIDSMSRNNMAKVSRLLKAAREEGTIPWEWIVDETRELERKASWRDPEAYLRVIRRAYRRDFWEEQTNRLEVWSEKGTIRGVLKPVLDEYGVGFRVMHGFGSATSVYDVAQKVGGERLIALYVGDWDPSGMFMSEKDLPERLARYGGEHVIVKRVALLAEDTPSLPSFPAGDKRGDPRYRWFVQNHGLHCWELDAMHPNDLRERVRESIVKEIDMDAWERCRRTQEAEQESLRVLLNQWGA